MLEWINPAGGLYYHLSAYRHRHTLWAPYISAIHRWLASWQPVEADLLLVGPSAGYSLSAEFLARFTSITAVEPDLLARWLFAKNHPQIQVQWSRHNLLAVSAHGDLSPSAVAENFPHHAVLFCNVLGQLPVLFPHATTASDKTARSEFLRWQESLCHSLNRQSWASFHDRFSCDDAPSRTDLGDGPCREIKDLITNCYGEAWFRSLRVRDHLTQNLWPTHSRRHLLWQRTKKIYHLIEAVHS